MSGLTGARSGVPEVRYVFNLSQPARPLKNLPFEIRKQSTAIAP